MDEVKPRTRTALTWHSSWFITFLKARTFSHFPIDLLFLYPPHSQTYLWFSCEGNSTLGKVLARRVRKPYFNRHRCCCPEVIQQSPGIYEG